MKQVVKLVLAAAAVAALAVPAMAADKLIVKDATGANTVFKVDDAGQIFLPIATGTGRGAAFKNAAALNNFPSVAVVPDASQPNQGTAMQVIPRGTGFSAGIKSQLSVFNTDYVADAVNYEFLALRAGGTVYSINSSKGGTGVARPIQFQINNAAKLTLDTTGYIGIGTATPSSPLTVVNLPVFENNAAALAGPPVLAAGAFYRTSAGVLMVVY